MDAFIGQLAALAAAALFSVTSVCYTLAGRKISSVTSIAMSLPISWLMMVGLHQLTLGEWVPTGATPDRWFYLSASGILAFVVTAWFWLNAYQHIGPRLTMLVATFAPVLGALLAWAFLGQTLPPDAIVGIAIVVFGIIWVVAERGKAGTDRLERDTRRGVIQAGLGTLSQASAFVFASQGVSGGFPPISATLIRITAGIIALWVFIAYQQKVKETVRVVWNDRRLLLLLTGAALSGPVIAGSLLLLSFQYVPVGVSTTLSHTTAVMLIPIGYLVFNERITPRAVMGTCVTVVGIAVLFS